MTATDLGRLPIDRETDVKRYSSACVGTHRVECCDAMRPTEHLLSLTS